MFRDVGNKIKVMAKVILVLGIIADIILAFTYYEVDSFWSIFNCIMGIVILIPCTYLIYGFGELIVKAGTISDKIGDIRETMTGVKADRY